MPMLALARPLPRLCAALVLLGLPSLGCAPGNIGVPVSEGESGGEESDPTGSDSTNWLTTNKDVDILFVIDNSGSMGEEQALLAQNLASFIEVLEHPYVDANYRIGITTSDNGNIWCPPGQTTPEGGRLVATPCTQRLGDFVFDGGSVTVEDLACNDICDLTEAELQILPTTTDEDPNPAPRPWLERIEGKPNLPEGTSMAEAFKCFAPQGINGCGFESQLESMHLALLRAQTSGEDSYGFMRQGAILAVVLLTDEADCSANQDYAEIFAADGDRVFWSDPNASFPSSAVCWNAGTVCTGDPSYYDSCEPLNWDVEGNPGVADEDAVLHPMSRYRELLQGIEDQKQQLDADREVLLSLIGGVDQSGSVFYAEVGSVDPDFQAAFGIGPGCEAVNPQDPDAPIRAVPPVRMRALVDAFSPGNMFSICAQDYSPALEAIAARIRDQLQPACYWGCAADSDPATALLEPECEVFEDPVGQGGNVEIHECLRDADGYVLSEFNDYTMPSDADNVCYALLVDAAGLTADVNDDLSDYCADDGFNLEFEIARRPGFPAVGGTIVDAECTLSASPEIDCPGL